MSEPDVLQDLDAWIALYPHADIAQRARDEITKLRETVEHHQRSLIEAGRQLAAASKASARIHAEALEEASKVCELTSDAARDMYGFALLKRCVNHIRALKDNRDWNKLP